MTKRKLSTHGHGFDRTSSSVVLQTAKSLIRYLPVTIEASLLKKTEYTTKEARKQKCANEVALQF
jgi:hypothetical protein